MVLERGEVGLFEVGGVWASIGSFRSAEEIATFNDPGFSTGGNLFECDKDQSSVFGGTAAGSARSSPESAPSLE